MCALPSLDTHTHEAKQTRKKRLKCRGSSQLIAVYVTMNGKLISSILNWQLDDGANSAPSIHRTIEKWVNVKKLFISQVSTGDFLNVHNTTAVEHQTNEHQFRSGRMPSLKNPTKLFTSISFAVVAVVDAILIYLLGFLCIRDVRGREKERGKETESCSVVCGVKHVVYSVFCVNRNGTSGEAVCKKFVEPKNAYQITLVIVLSVLVRRKVMHRLENGK